MIKYALICNLDHEFEAWFSTMADYDMQADNKLIECPFCQSTKVQKAIMAPSVSTGRKKEQIAKQQAESFKMMNAAAAKVRKEIEDKCDYVGNKFADEARAIHYGEKEERPIYGEASPREAAELYDEGVNIAPLPDILAPKPKNKQN